MNGRDDIEYVFGPDEPNPGCDCGMHDARVRLVGGALLCAEALTELTETNELEEGT